LESRRHYFRTLERWKQQCNFEYPQSFSWKKIRAKHMRSTYYKTKNKANSRTGAGVNHQGKHKTCLASTFEAKGEENKWPSSCQQISPGDHCGPV
jgi:hypothetical protein